MFRINNLPCAEDIDEAFEKGYIKRKNIRVEIKETTREEKVPFEDEFIVYYDKVKWTLWENVIVKPFTMNRWSKEGSFDFDGFCYAYKHGAKKQVLEEKQYKRRMTQDEIRKLNKEFMENLLNRLLKKYNGSCLDQLESTVKKGLYNLQQVDRFSIEYQARDDMDNDLLNIRRLLQFYNKNKK